MRNYTYRFVAVALCLALLAGCGNSKYGGSDYQAAEGNSVLFQNTDTTGLEPTRYGTVNDLDGVVMSVMKPTMNLAKLTVTFINTTTRRYIYGNGFVLEKKVNGVWYTVPMTSGYVYTTIGHSLFAGDYREWSVDLSGLYDRFDAGQYRIVKGVSYHRGPGDNDHYYLAAEFFINP